MVEGVEADCEREEKEREWILPGEVAGVEDVVLDRDRRSVSLEMVIGQLPHLVHEEGRQGERVEKRDPADGGDPEGDRRRNRRGPQEAEHLNAEDRPPVEGGELAAIARVERQGAATLEDEFAEARMEEGEGGEEEAQKDQERKDEHVGRIAEEAPQVAPFHDVGDVFGILRGSVHLHAVVVAVLPREERRGGEREGANEDIPGHLEDAHLVRSEVADLVDERAEPVEPEGCDRKGDQLRP